MVDHAKPAPLALSLRLDSVMVAALGFVLAAGPAAWNGGYFAGSWAWIALGTFSLATIRLILVPRVGLGRLDWALLALLAAFTGWLALSGLWSPALTPTLTEVVRALAYLGAVLLALLLVRRATVSVLLGSAARGRDRGQRLRAAHPTPARPHRQLGSGHRLPARRPDRLLERPRHLRGDGHAPRRRPRRPLEQPHRPGARGRRAAHPRDDDAVHVQPRRLARARDRPPRRIRRRSPPPAARRRRPRARALVGSAPRSSPPNRAR